MEIPFAYPGEDYPMYDRMVEVVDRMNIALDTINMDNKVYGDCTKFYAATTLTDIRKVLYGLYRDPSSLLINNQGGVYCWVSEEQFTHHRISIAYIPADKSIRFDYVSDNEYDPTFCYMLQENVPQCLDVAKFPCGESDKAIFYSQFNIPADAGKRTPPRPVAKTLGNAFIVMKKDTGYSRQIWFLSGKGQPLQTDKIDENWDEMQISSAACTSRGWLVAMSTRQRGISQSYWLSKTFPIEWILEKKVEGKMVTAITTSDSQWFTVLTAGSPYTDQVHCYDEWDVVHDFIQKWWNEDYYITHATWFKGKWFVVMSKTELFSDQDYFFADNFEELSQKISERWDEDKEINLIETGDSEIFCVMSISKNGKGGTEWFSEACDTIDSFIQEGYDEGYMITYLGD